MTATAIEAYALTLETEHRKRAQARSRVHTEYQMDPIGWAVDKLGISENTIRWSLNKGYDTHEWDGTPDPLVAMMEAIRDWKDVGVEAGTGTQKSFSWAIIILWFLASFENSICFTFAPKEDQLRLYIWKYIGELWPRFQKHFPLATRTDLTIRMRGGLDETWAAHGYAVGIKADEQVATKAAGMHATHMLLVYEEMPGIPQSIVEAGKNTLTAPHNLMGGIGNPNNQLDTLHKHCLRPGVVHIVASALDHPNVVTGNAEIVPGAVSRQSIEKRRLEYGVNSPIYQSRVRGVSPEQASDALIRLEWLKASAARFEERRKAGTLPKAITGKGVDVANSEHGDKAAVCDFYENTCPSFPAFQCPDANALGRQVKLQMDAAELPNSRCAIDAIGVGAGTVNELRRLGRIVQALYAGGKPMKMIERAPDGQAVEWSGDVNMFQNLTGQMLWQLREDLRLGVIDVEEDTELWEELIAGTYDDTSKVIVVEPKDELKVRLGRSPNKRDAMMMANWVRKRAVVPERTHPSKQPHRAWPLQVKDGKLVNPPKAPKTVEELANWAEERTAKSRLNHRERLPRRSRR